MSPFRVLSRDESRAVYKFDCGFLSVEVRTHELPLLIIVFPLLHAFILWICCNGINILFVHLVAYIFNSECVVNILCWKLLIDCFNLNHVYIYMI